MSSIDWTLKSEISREGPNALLTEKARQVANRAPTPRHPAANTRSPKLDVKSTHVKQNADCGHRSQAWF